MRVALNSLLLALAVVGASARPGPAVNVNSWASDVVDALKTWSGGKMEVDDAALDAFAGGKHHEHDHKFELLVKYIVRPSIGKPFVEEWLKVREEAVNATGNLHFTLSKPLTDNLIFYSWQQWESKADFFKFVKDGDEVKALAKYIEEKDIGLTLTQLIPIPAYHEHEHEHHQGGKVKHRAQVANQPLRVMEEAVTDVADTFQAWMQPAASSEVSSFAHGGRDPHSAILLTKFIVKPSELVKFVKASELMTKAVRKEKGSLNYGFTAELGNDYTLWNYAVWEDKKAVEKHLESCYAKKFLEFVLENDILTTTTILFPIESLDE